jgi:hypothetical protein
MKEERIIVIDINLTRGLVVLLALALLMAALVGYLAWGQREAAASGPQVSFGYPFDLAQGMAQDKPFGLASFGFAQDKQDRPLAQSGGLRGYYRTRTYHFGDEADGTDGNGAGVCAEGYHFASLWEILDPSNLKYNTTLGTINADSGQGPPALTLGWVRTGFGRSGSSTPGIGNCDGWDSNSDTDRGTRAYLASDWEAGQDIYVWEVQTMRCDLGTGVWCVED